MSYNKTGLGMRAFYSAFAALQTCPLFNLHLAPMKLSLVIISVLSHASSSFMLPAPHRQLNAMSPKVRKWEAAGLGEAHLALRGGSLAPLMVAELLPRIRLRQFDHPQRSPNDLAPGEEFFGGPECYIVELFMQLLSIAPKLICDKHEPLR